MLYDVRYGNNFRYPSFVFITSTVAVYPERSRRTHLYSIFSWQQSTHHSLRTISASSTYFCLMKQTVFFKDLGLRSYKEVWDLQEVFLKQNVDLKMNEATRNATVNHLFFVEHKPVYTLGKAEKRTCIN